MCILLEKADFLTGWGYQKMLSENVILEKAFSDNIRSGFLAPYQKSCFLISFSNSIRSGLMPLFSRKIKIRTHTNYFEHPNPSLPNMVAHDARLSTTASRESHISRGNFYVTRF